jgi:hypothetical protein
MTWLAHCARYSGSKWRAVAVGTGGAGSPVRIAWMARRAPTPGGTRERTAARPAYEGGGHCEPVTRRRARRP